MRSYSVPLFPRLQIHAPGTDLWHRRVSVDNQSGLAGSHTHNHLLFAAAMLHLSIADGLAAVIGTKYGKGNTYKVFASARA